MPEQSEMDEETTRRIFEETPRVKILEEPYDLQPKVVDIDE